MGSPTEGLNVTTGREQEWSPVAVCNRAAQVSTCTFYLAKMWILTR